jgi:tRNA A37 threonylcarbamoyladenosine dehydratase
MHFMNNEFNSEDFNQRFGGIARLYGLQGLKNLLNARVMIVGLGGVGSWAAESLARSGVGAITLVDLDDICITNTNRQLPAMSGEYGKLKIQVIKERILAINPQCQVHAIEDFFTEASAEAILDQNYDYVIDAIDSLKNKCLLAALCLEKNIPIIVTGGTAGKTNPLLITLSDLGDSMNDSLTFRMRKKLRQDFNFPSGAKFTAAKKQKFNIMCVYSAENSVYPTADGGTCNTPDPESNLKMDCESGMGSVSHITAMFGFMAAGHVINTLAQKTT